MATITEMHIDNLPFTLGYQYPVKHIPPVHKDPETGKWSIRIEKSVTQTGATTHWNWDYFKTDPDGLIVESPRGFAKQYNKRVRITGLEDWKAE